MSAFTVPFEKFGQGVGLHRVAAIARDLALDLEGLAPSTCVVTGSNGKGSVAAMSAAMLSASGRKTGLFISPHLFSIHERFAIDGEAISSAALAPLWSRVQDAARRYETAHPGDRVGGFEFLFLIAAAWFAQEQCDAIVWEAGIGGRYDPTRLVRARLTALVSLDFEHTALLGETLEEIAFDKLDACAQGGVVYVGETAWPLRARIETYCRLQGVTPTFLREGAGWRVEDDAIVIDLSAETLAVTPPLAGAHQRNNAALAVRLAHALGADEAAIVRGLAATRWPGRLETIGAAPSIVIDVGHTPDAIAAAKQGYLAAHAPGVLVCGASRDKKSAALIAALAPGFPVIVCTAARHKGADPEEIAAAARAAAPGAEVLIAPSVADAYRLARARAVTLGAGVYAAGGLFLATEFKAVHLGRDPAALDFF